MLVEGKHVVFRPGEIAPPCKPDLWSDSSGLVDPRFRERVRVRFRRRHAGDPTGRVLGLTEVHG